MDLRDRFKEYGQPQKAEFFYRVWESINTTSHSPRTDEHFCLRIIGPREWDLCGHRDPKSEAIPYFYARGGLPLENGETRPPHLLLYGQAFIDGHAGHHLMIIPDQEGEHLHGYIASDEGHAHGGHVQHDYSIKTHNGHVHWGPP